MGFRQGAYEKIWKIEDKGNYHVAQMSISRKNKDTGVYDTEWQNNFVRLVGTAHQQIATMDISRNVKIGSCDVTNKYDKDKNTTYTNYVVFNFEDNPDGGSKPAAPKSTAPNDFVSVPDDAADELPFD